MDNRAYVLAYHSQNILGTGYGNNDHVALAQDLSLIRELHFRVISALELASALRTGSFSSLPEKCVVITMDDGPIFDYEDVVHPRYGRQESMLNILRRQPRPWWQFHLGRRPSPPVVATAFVIGSKAAREQIALSLDDPQWMTDSWWVAAQQTPYLDIGCHSWDHVHPCVVELADRPELVGAFHRIDTFADAEREIADASRKLYSLTKSEAARLFAYPFGQTNEFLVREYLPSQEAVIAAFTTAAEPVTKDTDIWEVPRYVCGDHWKSGDGLRALLSGKA
jgi:hypothetical protein